MCSVCLMTPCHPSCPNAPEPKAAFYCRKCGEPILPEDEYARIDGDEYCEKCIDDMPFCELVPLLGGEWKTADGGKKVTCTGCGREISHGEEYGEFDGSALCEGCIDEVPYSELVERMNGEWNMASEEDIYDGYDG